MKNKNDIDRTEAFNSALSGLSRSGVPIEQSNVLPDPPEEPDEPLLLLVALLLAVLELLVALEVVFVVLVVLDWLVEHALKFFQY